MNPNANAGSAADTSERVKTAIEELSGIFESVVGDNVKRPPDFRSGKEDSEGYSRTWEIERGVSGQARPRDPKTSVDRTPKDRLAGF